MSIALEVLIAVFIILLFMARKEKIPVKFRKTKVLIPFYKLAVFVYKRTFGKESNFYYQKIYDKNSLIYAAKENRQITTYYFIEKIGLCLIVLFVGLIFVLGLDIKSSSESVLQDGNQIKRGTYTDSEKTVLLDATIDDEELKNLEITVNEIKYSKEEFEGLMDEFEKKLEEVLLGDNESSDRVNKNINFVDSIDNYPFLVEWKIDKREYIGSDGEIKESVPEEGVIVKLTAIISYEDNQKEYEFFINVFPKELTKSEMLEQKIGELIGSNQLESREDEYLTLPDNIDGMTIKWKDSKKRNTLVFVCLLVAVIIGIFLGKDFDLYKQIQNRNIQMMEDYAEIISKFTLYVGAGMSVVMAWKKIAKDYQNKKLEGHRMHFAYEEMTYTMYEMESGVEESKCYQHFADRVKVQKYVKLVSLLEQNIKMGTKGLIEDLKKEAEDAFNERKSMAEKKGEEAGTKLLLPMFMMLLIVMVVIMIPAFMSM